MSFAHEFLKPDKPFEKDMEESIIFIIDNYEEIIKIYRVMQAQNKETKEKKEKAHEDLHSLYEKIEKLKIEKPHLSEQEKITITETKEYLSNLREENDVVYYNGKPLDVDQMTYLMLKHQRIFSVLEQADRKLRKHAASILKGGTKAFLYPLSYFLRLSIKQTKKGDFKDLLKIFKQNIDNIPNVVKDKVLDGLDVDLSFHKGNIY